MTFPITEQVTKQVTKQVTEQVELLINILKSEMDRKVLQKALNLSHIENFRSSYLKPALELELIEMTILEKSNSRLQKYRLTLKGEHLRAKLNQSSN